MSFWQGLVDTYDVNFVELEKEFPLSTTSISNNSNDIIVIKLDGDGNHLGHYKIEKRSKDEKVINFVFPVSEESMGRSSGIYAHPIFDQFEYLSGSGDKFKAYIGQLRRFAESRYTTQQIKSIYNYISKKSISSDLSDMKVKPDINILFEVKTRVGNADKVWENNETIRAWHNYYISTKNQDESLDFITGELKEYARANPRKITNSSPNAKLISANDRSNFTYRGTFTNPEDALSIGYESSQKAHQFLRFLVRDRGLTSGEQVIITYQIGQDVNMMKLKNPLANSKSIVKTLRDVKKSYGIKNIIEDIGIDYTKLLKEYALREEKYNALNLHKKSSIVVLSEENTGQMCVKYYKEKTAIIILDAATTGRLAVKYYQELDSEEYLEKLIDWHETCKFNFSYFDKLNNYHNCIQTPSVDRIIKAMYVRQKTNNDIGYNKFSKTARECLIHCIFNGESIPRDYVDKVVRRASMPFNIKGKIYEKVVREYEEIVSIACALVRKSVKDVYELSLERENTKRDYLFGRLLGAAEKLESGENKKIMNERATIAVRYMSDFSNKPFKTWLIIRERLVPYIQSLEMDKSPMYLRTEEIANSEIEEIENMFKISDFENNLPLSGIFLIGYACEKAWISEEDIRLSRKNVSMKEEVMKLSRENTQIEIALSSQ
ncbi:MAG: type I-C CRISPR-associated protein Cas8c/Csd1 [Clostridioides sp.]|jgi:CRISPR-associated protein Csd1|nr:type I-C CRISPR-associated protein Cas8c/Csd1 [Clostridioides sp.]